MSCETNNELLELYALGLLDPDEREAVESHLRDNCVQCQAGLRRARSFNSAVLGSIPLEEPPAGLRKRVVDSVRPTRSRRAPVAWIGLAAGLAAATIWLGLDNQRRSNELAVARIESRNLQRRSEELGRSLAFLQDPETRPAVSKPEANKPRGTYFVNPRSGVMLIASNLPIPPTGRVYEMWVIPKGQAPRPAGLFRPEANGSAVHLQSGPLDLSSVQAFAITEEPETGSAAPTTQPFLITPAQGL
jgi:anti-sigma-K factor RskA